jgi:hypothetical protein
MENEKFTIDIEIPIFQISVNANNYKEAFKKACRILEDFHVLNDVYFEYVNFSTNGHKCTTKLSGGKRSNLMPTDWQPFNS